MAGGVVRAARRPAGWVAPGPRPRGAEGRPELLPAEDEDLCLLAGDWRILQKLRGHRWSMDDLVTAWIATQAAPEDTVHDALDLGCGIGSVLMMVAWSYPHARCVGVEAQAVSAGLARRSLGYNGADDRVQVRDGDLRDPQALPPDARFDLITGTPPYFPPGAGTESDKVQCGPCRFEHRGGVEDYCAAASRHLRPGGVFVVCGAAGEDPRARDGAARHGLAVQTHWEIVPREGAAPLLGVWVMRHAAEVAAEGPRQALVVRDRAGQWTPAFRAVRAALGMPDVPPRG